MRHTGLIILLLLCTGTLNGQSYGELQKEAFGNGLYKVRSGSHYGIFDSRDNVIVSVEYENILPTADSIAVIRKNNGCVYGTVKQNGQVNLFTKADKYHTSYPFYNEGFLPVKNLKNSSKEKWFFVDEKGIPLTKDVGGFISPRTFRSVMPFSEGYASVVTNKGKVQHVDITGQERFIINNEVVIFRASINNGEAVIVTRNGVKVYQEEKQTHAAKVKRALSPYSIYKTLKAGPGETVLEFKDGKLYLDFLGRATKFIPNNGETVVFGVKEVVKEVRITTSKRINTPVESIFDIEDISVDLKQKIISADSKGWAGVTIIFRNNSNLPSGNLDITIKSDDIIPVEKKFALHENGEQSIRVSLPARFSETKQNRTVIVIVTDGSRVVEKKLIVSLRRYEVSNIL